VEGNVAFVVEYTCDPMATTVHKATFLVVNLNAAVYSSLEADELVGSEKCNISKSSP
jgi:hypothetical protein